MSNTPHHPHDDGTTVIAEPSAAQPLAEWRARLDRFGAAFDAEISEILTTLSSLKFEEADKVSPAATTNDQTMEFTLPKAPPTLLPAESDPPQKPPARETAAEPNRLAALKAKLSQQMASTGSSCGSIVRSAEEGRS